ncbi:MAG: dienelactone hydrolase family protein [Ardenticatenaceae bacterium]|nr:dienelactone hydrolase family protein [Ardenticatenaceae bacterium]HBY95424.1 dienelactone hydrolase family protein [Chloroflexota bacterium]
MNDFQRYLVEEYVEDYQGGHLTRREALRHIAAVTGNLAVANTLLATCTPPAQSTATPAAMATSVPAATSTGASSATTAPTATNASGTVAPDDPAIEAGMVEFPGEGATLMASLARPKGDGSSPVVLVCHENRGLTDHIKDVARRFAKAGYVALAVDLLSRQGGTAAITDQAQIPGTLGNTPPEQFVQDFISGWRYLQSQSFAAADRVGMVGFCFGGGVTWRVATAMPELRAAVPFYGPHPPVEQVPNIQAAVLAIYGERDQRINQGIPVIEAAMEANNKIYQKVIYPNADHAFFNDTGPRYDPEAARDAWQQTLAWLAKYV